MGGGQKSSQEQQVSRRMPGLLKPYVKDILGRAQTAADQVSTDPYGGQFYASVLPQETQANTLTTGYGQGLGTTAGQGVYDLGQAQARGDFLTPESNPYLQPYIQNINDEVMRNYAQARKGVTSASIAEGAYGGDRGQLAQSDLASQTNRAISDSTTNLLYQNYLQERQNQQNAGGLIQQGVGLNLLGPQIMGESGGAQRQLNQVALDEALAKFNEGNAAPFRGLNEYANLVYGSAPTYINTLGNSAGSSGSSGGAGGSILGIIMSLLGAGSALGG